MPIWNRNDSAKRIKYTVKDVISDGLSYTVLDGDRIAADTTLGSVSIDATNLQVNSFWVFDAYNTFHLNSCQIEFDPTTIVVLDKRGDYFYFYKGHGVWHWQELTQLSTGEL